MKKLVNKWICAIIENNNWDILVVEEKETREEYSKFKWDISLPMWKIWDNIKNEDTIDALYREVLEETWLNLNENKKENKILPCELLFWYLSDIKWKVLFKVTIFHIKLNWVLKKYEEKILNNEIENAYFISKEEFQKKIEEWWIRAWADVFYEKFIQILKIENSKTLPNSIRQYLLQELYLENYNFAIVWPWSNYNLKKEWK